MLKIITFLYVRMYVCMYVFVYVKTHTYKHVYHFRAGELYRVNCVLDAVLRSRPSETNLRNITYITFIDIHILLTLHTLIDTNM